MSKSVRSSEIRPATLVSALVVEDSDFRSGEISGQRTSGDVVAEKDVPEELSLLIAAISRPKTKNLVLRPLADHHEAEIGLSLPDASGEIVPEIASVRRPDLRSLVEGELTGEDPASGEGH